MASSIKQSPRQPSSRSLRPIGTEAALRRALRDLEALDPKTIAPLVARCGRMALRRREPSFAALASIIISQQLSVASAEAIFARTLALLQAFEPTRLTAVSDLDLRNCGLSAAKIGTLRAVAAAIAEGLDLAVLATSSALEAHECLIAIKGVGPWTADTYLLSCGHPDVWPAGDLALQEAVKLALALKARPSAKELVAIAERWRPYRAIAARLFWAYYRMAKNDPPAKP